MHKQRIIAQNFDSIYEAIRGGFKLVFSRGREQMVINNTFNKIFLAQQIKFKAYFGLWRQRVKELNIIG